MSAVRDTLVLIVRLSRNGAGVATSNRDAGRAKAPGSGAPARQLPPTRRTYRA